MKLTKDNSHFSDSELGDLSKLTFKDRVKVAKQHYKVANRATPNFNDLVQQLHTLSVALPEKDEVDLDEINKRFAIVQRYFTEASRISMDAIAIHAMWHRLKMDVLELVETRKSSLLLLPSIQGMKNVASQNAAVRTKIERLLSFEHVVKTKEAEAKAFVQIAEGKKKDLSNTMTNLSRMFKVLKLEHGVTNY